MTFDNNSAVFFKNNIASNGATIFSIHNSKMIVKGNSSIVFNDLSVKWCNKTYPGESDAVTIDTNGIVWCKNQK